MKNDRVAVMGHRQHWQGWTTPSTSSTGATLRDLMDRMGNATTRAALIDSHKSAGRDRAIADALSKMIEDLSRRDGDQADVDDSDDDDEPDEGSAGVRVPRAS